MAIRSWACAGLVGLSAAVVMAQDATTSAPSSYRTQFENEFVHLVRVHYGPNETVPVHEHPTSETVYIYLNASGVVEFHHIGNGNRVSRRRPTIAGSFRVSGGADEKHEVVNTAAAPSDFLRVELKTDSGGAAPPFFRDATKTYPAGDNVTDVRFVNAQMRITRVIVAPGKTLDQSTAAREPALLVALEDATLSGFRPGGVSAIAVGQERWLDAGQQTRLVNGGSSPAPLLRIDFLTAPRK
jgi:hypothetical protein